MKVNFEFCYLSTTYLSLYFILLATDPLCCYWTLDNYNTIANSTLKLWCKLSTIPQWEKAHFSFLK